MLKKFKFSTQKNQVWFTSDPHYNHNRGFIIGPRGFVDIAEHDDWLKNEWNKVVAPDDTVILLGDVALSSSVEATKSFLRSLNGSIYKIWGNHVSYTSKIYREEVERQFGRSDIEVYPLTWDGKVTFLGTQVQIIVDNQLMTLSHFPMRIWEHSHHGSWNLSGHSHSNDVGRNPDTGEGKCLDVGVDNFKRPIAFSELKAIMDGRQAICLDHHNSQTT